MKTLDLASVITDVKNLLSQNPAPIKRAGVFGSLATGQFNDESDIDIAIEYDPGENFDFDRFVKFCELCELLSESVSSLYGRDVDIIPIEDHERNIYHDVQGEIVWI